MTSQSLPGQHHGQQARWQAKPGLDSVLRWQKQAKRQAFEWVFVALTHPPGQAGSKGALSAKDPCVRWVEGGIWNVNI